jgi:hypothetical protein
MTLTLPPPKKCTAIPIIFSSSADLSWYASLVNHSHGPGLWAALFEGCYWPLPDSKQPSWWVQSLMSNCFQLSTISKMHLLISHRIFFFRYSVTFCWIITLSFFILPTSWYQFFHQLPTPISEVPLKTFSGTTDIL